MASSHLGTKTKPDWAGDDALSKVVNAAIGFKPLYAVMKVLAKRVYEGTAEKNGVPWKQTVRQLAATPEVYEIKVELEDASINYPSYYLQPFHAYKDGNLNWQAAFEAEPATLAMALRTFRHIPLGPMESQQKLRDGIHAHIKAYQDAHRARPAEDILDVGCSVGVSTRYLAEEFADAQVTGLDLSPHFLAVAELQERRAKAVKERPTGSLEVPIFRNPLLLHRKATGVKRQRIKYMHALGEQSQLPGSSFDLICSTFVIHECRPFAIQDMFNEAARLLRPGGVYAVSDNNPRSETIQNLPPALFTLMKSTEPWSDEYYVMDVEAAMRAAGFESVVTKEAYHRHRTILGFKQI